ncbi:hypothetical protein [Streptomyces sp. NPDC001297]|uniref:hypothetical protein n=1 Tax=Streptomyces sp. NPDC001297 TaxID=3364559 RepID=UPI0036AA8729
MSSTWTETARVLRERGEEIGPFLLAIPRACVEVVVASGTAAVWPPLPSTVCVSGAVVRCPAPTVHAASGLPPVSGRLWAIPPVPGHPENVTDADALAEAVGAALLRRAHWTRARLNAHAKEPQP